MMIGESIFILPRLDVIEKLEEMSDSTSAECNEIEEKISKIKQAQAELKVILYAKFRNSINLEE